MGVPAEHHAAFFAMSQQHYHALVQAGEISSVAVVKALQDAKVGYPAIAQVPVVR